MLHVAHVLRLGHRTPIHGRFIGQRSIRNLCDNGAAIFDTQHAVVRHFADVDRVEIPLVENALDLGLAAALHDEQHALLRFRQHDLVGRHRGLALRDQRDVDLDAGAAP